MLREQIRTIARVTDRPFCVNLVLDFAQDERLEVVVEERVPWVSFSFGLRSELVRLARAGGFACAGAGCLRRRGPGGGRCGRRRADRAGCRGRRPRRRAWSVCSRCWPRSAGRCRCRCSPRAESPTRRPRSPRSPLVPSAVVMGTRFVASDECDAHPHYKARLLAAEGRDTVLTELFDVGWQAPHRVLRNRTYERWLAAGRPPPGQRPGESETVAVGIPRYAPQHAALLASTGDVEAMAMYAGQGVGNDRHVEPAAAIVERSLPCCNRPGLPSFEGDDARFGATLGWTAGDHRLSIGQSPIVTATRD